jgi:hypothetical protein
MKKLAITLLCAVALVTLAKTQPTTKQYDLKDFDKVNLQKVNSDVTIKLGSSFAIEANGNSAILDKIEMKVENNQLVIIQESVDYKIWEQNRGSSITITMPEISVFTTNSNGDVTIGKFTGRYLRIKASGNGDVKLTGKQVDELDIEASGNGNVHTQKINADKVNVKKSGNGDVTISTKNTFTVSMAGNGDVVNYEKGQANITEKAGNGEVKNKKEVK